MTFFSFIITCICICVPKYNLSSLYDVTCVGVFSGPTIRYCISTRCALPDEDDLLLSACLTANSFCVELLVSCGLSHFHLGMSTLFLFSSCLGMTGHVGEIFPGAASNITKRHSLKENFLIIWLLQSFQPIFWNVP